MYTNVKTKKIITIGSATIWRYISFLTKHGIVQIFLKKCRYRGLLQYQNNNRGADAQIAIRGGKNAINDKNWKFFSIL